MDGILLWLAAGAAGLFFVAVVVAWWEHLGRNAAPAEPLAGPQAAAHGLNVDVDLDVLRSGDTAQRREALDGAMERMTQPGALHEHRQRWTDTTPMVGPGPRVQAVQALRQP